MISLQYGAICNKIRLRRIDNNRYTKVSKEVCEESKEEQINIQSKTVETLH